MFISNLQNRYKYSLRRSRRVFHHARELLLKKKSQAPQDVYQRMKQLLSDLKEAIDNKDSKHAYSISTDLLKLTKAHFKKSIFDYLNEWVMGLGFTLLTVTLINQLWFQHYQIPSGSMRPTLLEKDRVIATKSCFGINFPFKQSHLYFNADNLKRGNIAIFTADNLPPEENKTRYLFLFNTKKQMVKRLIGKPGDTLYFYGGKIYGLDKDQNPIKEFQDSKIFESLEHVPISNFEGKIIANEEVSKRVSTPVYLSQMGQEVAKLYVNSQGSLHGKFSNGHQWVDESPKLEYKDLWGIKNFAMVRMLDRKQAIEMGFDLKGLSHPYFLELNHSPHTNYPRPHLGVDLFGRFRPMLTPEKSLLPLSEKHMQKIKDAMMTARFVVKDGRAGNYSMQRTFKPHQYSPAFAELSDGTYEFIDGVAYQIRRSGSQKKLSMDHPLNSRDPKVIQKLFNLGMEMITLYEPDRAHKDFLPHRFAYYRDGDIHLLNHKIFEKDDPVLQDFVASEKTKARGFVDYGSPIVDGKIDSELIRNYGLHIPNGYYLFLGDNHAGSRDCRDFGFIPEKNIQGSPAVIIWPSSSRFGFLNQTSLRWFNLPNLVVWSVALLALSATTLYTRKHRKKEI